MIRPAKFGDIPAIVELMEEGHARSKYAGRDFVDPKEAKRLLMASIQRQGLKGEGGACVFVTDQVDGFTMGMVDRVYHIGTKLMAQNLFYYARETARPQDRLALFDAYIGWASAIPGVIEIHDGITDIVGDVDRVEALYRRRGFTRCGVIMERKIG